MTKTRARQQGLIISLFYLLMLSGCATLSSEPDKGTLQTTYGGVSESERKTLEAEGWVYNEPGKPHTHVVRLPECPDLEQVITHIHEGEQAKVGWHKHNGCFTCPPPVDGVQRIL